MRQHLNNKFEAHVCESIPMSAECDAFFPTNNKMPSSSAAPQAMSSGRCQIYTNSSGDTAFIWAAARGNASLRGAYAAEVCFDVGFVVVVCPFECSFFLPARQIDY